MESNALLSICIPTFNRCERLKVCLERLLPLLQPYGIPIFISDNASTDGTKQLVHEMQLRYPFINYSCNESNIGFAGNFEKVLSLSNTAYRWCFGDDDYFDGSVGALLQILQNTYSMVVLNRDSYFGKSIQESKYYSDMNDFLADMGGHVSFISTMIFSEAMVKGAPFEKHKTSNFIQLGVVFDYLAGDSHSVYCYSDITVRDLPGFTAGYVNKVFQLFIVELVDTIKALDAFYTTRSKKASVQRNSRIFSFPDNAFICFSGLKFTHQISMGKVSRSLPHIFFALPPSKALVLILYSVLPSHLLLLLKKIKRKLCGKSGE